jgi:hypothetical protein
VQVSCGILLNMANVLSFEKKALVIGMLAEDGSIRRYGKAMSKYLI